MNKALEQKLIGPLEESHTEEQSPKAVLWMELWARRLKMAARWARTRAWVGWWFFWEEEEVCGGWHKWRGATVGPQGTGHAQGGGRTLDPRGQVPAPPDVFSVPNVLKYSRKNILNWQGIWRTFIFGVFLYCTDNSENRQKSTIFTLFQLNNRK